MDNTKRADAIASECYKKYLSGAYDNDPNNGIFAIENAIYDAALQMAEAKDKEYEKAMKGCIIGFKGYRIGICPGPVFDPDRAKYFLSQKGRQKALDDAIEDASEVLDDDGQCVFWHVLMDYKGALDYVLNIGNNYAKALALNSCDEQLEFGRRRIERHFVCNSTYSLYCLRSAMKIERIE